MTVDVRPKFGVEIEVSNREVLVDDEYTRFNMDEFVRLMNEVGLTCVNERYNHETRQHWKATTDSSCGYEIVSPPLHWEDRHSVREVFRLLRQAGANIDHRCGFHVHHEWPWISDTVDYREQRRKLLDVVHLYEQCEPLLRVLMPDSRFWKEGEPEIDDQTGDYFWARRYCRWNEGAVIDSEKYMAVNTQPLSRIQTVEFRQHQGTLNARKALAWVELTRMIVHAASLDESQIKAPTRVEMVFDRITPGSWAYFNDRAEKAQTTMTSVINEITEETN